MESFQSALSALSVNVKCIERTEDAKIYLLYRRLKKVLNFNLGPEQKAACAAQRWSAGGRPVASVVMLASQLRSCAVND